MEVLMGIADPDFEDRILDVGGGTGRIGETLANFCEVWVLDPDDSKIAFGVSRRRSVKFIEGNAQHIPFPNRYFSKVLAIVSFHHISDQDGAIREIWWVLRPNGSLIIHELDPTTFKGRQVGFFENAILRMNSRFYTPVSLREKLIDHGFTQISIIPSNIGYFLKAERASHPEPASGVGEPIGQ
jgi:ubiquinone/menaquinone biosynthesis C-methylase UbiE